MPEVRQIGIADQAQHSRQERDGATRVCRAMDLVIYESEARLPVDPIG